MAKDKKINFFQTAHRAERAGQGRADESVRINEKEKTKMKRLIALILVVLMLGSTAAFAAEVDTKLGVSSENAILKTEDKSGSMATELWLQVDADGQIDVTVPLVLVFKTNIDGGKAQVADNYKIMNNNNAPIVVTNVVVTEGAAANRTNVPGTLKLVGYVDGKTLNEDEYMVRLTVNSEDVKVFPAKGTGTFDFYDANNATYASYGVNANEGGLFALNRVKNETEPTQTRLTADMATGSFSFVTMRSDNDEFVEKNGVHLNTVTYTVAFDTSVQAGGTITTAAQNSDTPATSPNYEKIEWSNGTDNP